jgi:type I restriction enzyme M protein
MNISVEKHSNLVYEGPSNYGHPVWPLPILLLVVVAFEDVPGLAKVVALAEIAANASNLSIPLYVKLVAAAPATQSNSMAVLLHSAWDQWQTDGRKFWQQMDGFVDTLAGLAPTQRQ